jgi:protein TonB
VNDAVDRVLIEREALDQGFSGGFVLASVAHAFALTAVLVVPVLFPTRPRIDVDDDNVLMVELPMGGLGAPTSAPPAPGPPATQPPAPEPPKIVKPPKEEPKRGLPPPDAKRSRPRPEKSPPPAPRAGAPGGTGTSPQTPGLAFGVPGVGTPGGTGLTGDYYLASVQQKIWMIWNQQITSGARLEVTVSFTILADGSVADIRVVQSSGTFLFDQAAQRAVQMAQPFTPLPKSYGTSRYTIQAVFRPVE